MRQIDSIKRSEIVKLLDRIEGANGPVMADHVLAILRRLMNWHAGRSDEFRSPIVRGMARSKPKERARERILTDDEIRAIWRGTEDWPSPYAYLARFLLLTATRLCEAAHMGRNELTGTAWLIPGAGHKSKRELLLPLSQSALLELDRIPQIGKQWVFTFNGAGPMQGFAKGKKALDERVLSALRRSDPNAQMPNWTWHDLRRTSRSLMSRAGVRSDIAERCLGHVIPGVQGVYDRHSYVEEKQTAFEALAGQIERIRNPEGNVLPIGSAYRVLAANDRPTR